MSSKKLRAILGKSGVKKRSSPAKAATSPSPRRTSSTATSPALRRQPDSRQSEEAEEDFFDDKLEDHGLARSLATDLSLRDVVQTMRHILDSMFSSMPDQGSGMNSTRTAEVLNFRRALPRLVTANHVQTLMGSATAAEKEMVELVRAGVIRRVVVQRRGWRLGEMLILAKDMEAMVKDSAHLDEETRIAFQRLLREEPVGVVVDVSKLDYIPEKMVDRLMRAGFLTQQSTGVDVSLPGLFSRPEDRITLMSLETVAKAASGSMAAVGGEGAVHAAGGSGGKGGINSAAGVYAIAVPGTGAFLKLTSAALTHLSDLLVKYSRHREATETWLRNRWDGGLTADEVRIAARKARGQYIGVSPGRTKKWREFQGLAMDWILAEAIGAGVVEIFETGSVGRGVRLR
jgi:hypothetical protein